MTVSPWVWVANVSTPISLVSAWSRVLNDAVAGGAMPVVRRLIEERGYRVVPIYSGLPASTPAAQAEFFYGVPMVVPAYAFVDRKTGRLMRMSHHDAAAGVERRL